MRRSQDNGCVCSNDFRVVYVSDRGILAERK
ncbi:hypothetical protein [Listeria phage vB_Lmo_3274]